MPLRTQAGQKTQVSNLVVVALLVRTLLLLTPLFTDLPEAALGAIVNHAVVGLLRFGPIRALWDLNRVDFWAAAATLLDVLLFDVPKPVDSDSRYGATVVAGASVVAGAPVVAVDESSLELFTSTMISTTMAAMARITPMTVPNPEPLFCVTWTVGTTAAWEGLGASVPGAGGVVTARGSTAVGSVLVFPLLLT